MSRKPIPTDFEDVLEDSWLQQTLDPSDESQMLDNSKVLELPFEPYRKTIGRIRDPELFEPHESETYFQSFTDIPGAGQESYPEQWDYYYPNWQSVGPERYRPWGRKDFPVDQDKNDFYHNLLFMTYDYTFVTTDPKYKGRDNELDHQIWIVSKTVRRGVMLPTKEYFACKVAGIGYYMLKHQVLKRSVAALLRESQTLLLCNHENVVNVLESIALEGMDSGFPYNFVAIIMEYLDGDLCDAIKTEDRVISDEFCRVWVRDVAKALVYLHNPTELKTGDRNVVIVHMALRPPNILFKRIGQQVVYKLADFEESYVYDFGAGERDYIPEWAMSKPYRHRFSDPILKENPLPNDLHTRPLDIFSLGYGFAYIYTANSRERGRDYKNQVKSSYEPNSVMNLIHGMLNTNVRLRLTANQVLAHPWLNKSDEEWSDDDFISDEDEDEDY